MPELSESHGCAWPLLIYQPQGRREEFLFFLASRRRKRNTAFCFFLFGFSFRLTRVQLWDRFLLPLYRGQALHGPHCKGWSGDSALTLFNLRSFACEGCETLAWDWELTKSDKKARFRTTCWTATGVTS